MRCFAQLSEAPAEADARAQLAKAGFTVGTFAGNVATGAVDARRLSDVLALSWVTGLQMPTRLAPR